MTHAAAAVIVAGMADEVDGSNRRWRHAVRTATSRIEWPTVAVAGAIVIGVTATVLGHERTPAPITILLLGVLGAWFGSLRHEVVHGHPTPWRWLNTAVVAAPLGLTEPFWHYREAHLQHHATDDLTSPLSDPESQYLSAADWQRRSRLGRAIRTANTTLAGRLVVGPWLSTGCVLRDLIASWRRGERRASIVRFVAADLMVLVVVAGAGLPIWQYLLGAVYLAMALTLVRSYAEHFASPRGSRTAVVHGGRFWSLLFLNNNLHVTHHDRPDLAWYRIPAAHATGDADRIAADGAGLYAGYGQIFRRHLLRPRGPGCDPLERSMAIR